MELSLLCFTTFLFFSEKVKNNGGYVFAFEPQQQNYNLLKNNIKRNNINNAILFNFACGNTNEIIQMPIINENSNLNMGDFTPNYNLKKENSITCSVSLDSMYFPKIDLIKIDVQGWETKVLQGAEQLLKVDNPILIIELEEVCLNRVGTSCQNLVEYIRSLDYEIFFLDYIYPSDHVCVHKSMINTFEEIFKPYIFDHTESNSVNRNIEIGINRKIKML